MAPPLRGRGTRSQWGAGPPALPDRPDGSVGEYRPGRRRVPRRPRRGRGLLGHGRGAGGRTPVVRPDGNRPGAGGRAERPVPRPGLVGGVPRLGLRTRVLAAGGPPDERAETRLVLRAAPGRHGGPPPRGRRLPVPGRVGGDGARRVL